MVWVTKLLAVGALLGLAAPVVSASSDAADPHLIVYVSDSAQTPARSLAQAEREAGRIFQQAGISLEFVDCSSDTSRSAAAGCQRTPHAGELAVRILPRARQVPGGVFGTSFLEQSGGVYADIFLDRVRQLRELDPSLTLEPILGGILAHELGHLLLGAGSHTLTGLMQANWKYPQLRLIEMGQLVFNSSEAALLRERVAFLQSSAPVTRAASSSEK